MDRLCDKLSSSSDDNCLPLSNYTDSHKPGSYLFIRSVPVLCVLSTLHYVSCAFLLQFLCISSTILAYILFVYIVHAKILNATQKQCNIPTCHYSTL